MNPEFNSPEFQERQAVDEFKTVVPTQEEAINIIRDFWQAMSHGADIVRLAEQDGDWKQELTAGDRTSISRARGGWQVRIAGNHQPLTREATEYLASKGLI